MKPKPRALTWLEDQTGETISYEPPSGAEGTRHLSVRLPVEEASRLEQLAEARGVTLSQLVRTILARAVDDHGELTRLAGAELADRLAADVEEVRRRLVG